MSAQDALEALEKAPLFEVAVGQHGFMAVKLPTDNWGTSPSGVWLVLGVSGWSIMRPTMDNAEDWQVVVGQPEDTRRAITAAIRRLVNGEEQD